MNKVYALFAVCAISSCAHYQSYLPRQEFANAAESEMASIQYYTPSETSVKRMHECDKLKKKEKRSECFRNAVEVGIANINLTYDRMDQKMVQNHFIAYRDTTSVSYAKGLGLTGKLPDDFALSYSSLVYYEEMARFSHKFERERELYGYHRSEVDFHNAMEQARMERISQAAQNAATDARLRNIEQNTAPYPGIQTNSNVQIQFPR